ncbi:ABC transporter permease [Thermogladius sp. 4427co]|uniref:ABC transporter permease n=1 Tax=Thermogladius sp. 4427co TaxID=3450718 RepID=UPI003F78CB8D
MSMQKPSITRTISQRFIKPLASGIREVWSYGTGKIGLILLVILVAVSISATITMPSNLLAMWESPSFWDENPLLVPPQWVSVFGQPVAPQKVVVLTMPASTVEKAGFIYYTYTATYRLQVPQYPQDVIAKVLGVAVFNITTNGSWKIISPTITFVLNRPDNLTLVLATSTPAVPGVTGLYARTDTKLSLTNYNDIAAALVNKYVNETQIAQVIGSNTTLVGTVKLGIINNIATLMRSFSQFYVFGRLFVNITLGNITAAILPIYSSVREVYESLPQTGEGVEIVRSSLNRTLVELGLAMSSKTPSDMIPHLYNALGNATQAYALSIPYNILTANQSSTLSSSINGLSKVISDLETTTKYYNIDVRTEPLQGVYTAQVIVSYSTEAPVNQIQGLPVNTVRVIFKGSAYGLLGTDDMGRDLAVILYYGFPVAMAIGLTAAIATTLIGLILGVISGYYGGWVDELIQRTVDVIGNIPLLPILILLGQIALMVFVNNPFMVLMTIITVLIVFGWGGLAITVRTMTLSIKEEPYIEAALALGASHSRIIVKHILPQVAAYGVASMVFSVPGAILTEAGLSVLGIRSGYPTWGAVLSRARDSNRFDVWWWIFPPGLLISITSLAFVLVGLAIERIVEPRLRTL